MKIQLIKLFVLNYLLICGLFAQSKENTINVDLKGRQPDLTVYEYAFKKPNIKDGVPLAGKLVRQKLPEFKNTKIHHLIYLPKNWTPQKKYPVIFEYNGQGSYVDETRACGYGISGGTDFIWVVLPFVTENNTTETNNWWGETKHTVGYAKKAVAFICENFGGDKNRIVLTGHSRGAIACNYIGLYDEDIASLWTAMIPISHYDGRTDWRWAGMTVEDATIGARERIHRLGKTPQLICGEYHLRTNHTDANDLKAVREGAYSDMAVAIKELDLVPLSEIEGVRDFVKKNYPQGNITFLDLPFVNHSNAFLFMDVPERKMIRDWLFKNLKM